MAKAIQTLTHSIDLAAQAATQIVAFSHQQSVGMDQISQAMDEIKNASDQNVTSSEQVETTAQNLHILGGQLQQTAAQFTV